MGDNSTQEIVGKRKMKINMIVGVNNIFATFSDVIYVLGLTKLSFFCKQSNVSRYSVEFGDDFCEVRNNQKKIVADGVFLKNDFMNYNAPLLLL
jgi:hypothetical protein